METYNLMTFNSIKNFVEHYSTSCQLCKENRSLTFSFYNDLCSVIYDNFFEECLPTTKEEITSFDAILGQTEQTSKIAFYYNINSISLDTSIEPANLIIELELKCKCSYIKTSSLKLFKSFNSKYKFSYLPFTINEESASFQMNNIKYYILNIGKSKYSVLGKFCDSMPKESHIPRIGLDNIKNKEQLLNKINLRLTFL